MNQKQSIDYILTQSPESERKRKKSVAALKRFSRIHGGEEVKLQGKATAATSLHDYPPNDFSYPNYL
jgi:hypothetical protein